MGGGGALDICFSTRDLAFVCCIYPIILLTTDIISYNLQNNRGLHSPQIKASAGRTSIHTMAVEILRVEKDLANLVKNRNMNPGRAI